MNTMTIQWVSSASVWVASVVAHTDASATIAPTDRSMPPPVITNVMPTLTTPITEASRRIVSTLSMLANRSPAVTTPTMQSSTSATTRPRLRPAAEPSSSAEDAAAVLAWCAASGLLRAAASGAASVSVPLAHARVFLP